MKLLGKLKENKNPRKWMIGSVKFTVGPGNEWILKNMRTWKRAGYTVLVNLNNDLQLLSVINK